MSRGDAGPTEGEAEAPETGATSGPAARDDEARADDDDDEDDEDEDDEDDEDDDDAAEATGGETMSPRHVRSAARVLFKEARKILAKHEGRIAARPAQAMRDAMAKIEALKGSDDIAELERQAKRLDELLHEHAAFARKSALRETIENILIAVFIALSLRACLYEPFKIPSGSMMPTLRAGDHIFVNKFTYGIQIPFTTTVVGQSFGEIERGDVIVFRWPLDESEDYIKRVMGLPGDEIRVNGRRVEVKHAGDADFQILPHEPLNQRCRDAPNNQELANCTLFQETHGDKAYVVRYVLTPEERGDAGNSVPRTWRVPEGHLLVMGDNRNQSSDSLAWTVRVDAVRAEKLLTSKDLRDLTTERLFEMKQGSQELADVSIADPQYDRVTYTASHRSAAHDLSLDVWRKSTLGSEAVFQTLRARLRDANDTTMAELAAGKGKTAAKLAGKLDDAGPEAVGAVRALVVGKDDEGRAHAIVHLAAPDAVLHLSCGASVCGSKATLGLRLWDAVATLRDTPEQEARLLLQRSRKASYSSHWSGRHNPTDHYLERRFAGAGGERGQVRMRAFRDPQAGVALIRDAALWGFAPDTRRQLSPTPDGPSDPAPATESWLAHDAAAWTLVLTDHEREFVVVLLCGRAVCRDERAVIDLGQTVEARIAAAASDRRRMADLLQSKDLDGVPETPVAAPELSEFDQVRLEGTIRDKAYRAQLQAWLTPAEDIADKMAELSGAMTDAVQDDAVADGGYYSEAAGKGHTFLFAVPQSGVIMQLTCKAGLCPDKATARALAQRAATTALDPATFIDRDAQKPRPFVPRGNVKGRAERIWLPLSRFWLPIR